MKAIKVILKICAIVLLVLGAACLIYGYLDEIKAKLPCRRRPAEFDDYADVCAE